METKSGLNKKNVAAKFWPPFFASHLQIWTTQSSQFQGLWSMKSSASKICYFFKSIYENGFLLENPKLFFIIIIICPSLFQHRPQHTFKGEIKLHKRKNRKKQICIKRDQLWSIFLRLLSKHKLWNKEEYFTHHLH